MSGASRPVQGAGRPLIRAWEGHIRRSLYLVGQVPVLFIFLIHTTGDTFCVATCSPGNFLNVCVVPAQVAGFVSMCVSHQPEGGCSGGSLHMASCPLAGGALPLPLKPPPYQPTPPLEGTPSRS